MPSLSRPTFIEYSSNRESVDNARVPLISPASRLRILVRALATYVRGCCSISITIRLRCSKLRAQGVASPFRGPIRRRLTVRERSFPCSLRHRPLSIVCLTTPEPSSLQPLLPRSLQPPELPPLPRNGPPVGGTPTLPPGPSACFEPTPFFPVWRSLLVI